MMSNSHELSVRNLQIIAALDSLSYGVIYGFISPYLLRLGGTHISIAFLTIGNFLGELLSPEVTNLFTHIHGKRYALYIILNTAFVTNILMVLTYSVWFTILIRILFSLTNQSQNVCLDLLLGKAQNEKMKETIQRNYSILSGGGYILGPIISGYLFDYGFGYTGILAASLAFINTRLIMGVSKDKSDTNPEHSDKSVLDKAKENVIENCAEIRKCKPEKHWDMLLIKYLFSGSIIIFFSKFTQILRNNYEAGSITMGYTGAYINILFFAASYYVPVAKLNTEKYPVLLIMEISFLLMAVLMLFACYAPYYELYMILIIPVTFLRTLIISLWKDLFSTRQNESLNKLNKTASIVAGLTIPLYFGFLCNQIAHNAVILFSVIPMFLCWAILRWHSKYVKIDEEESRKDAKQQTEDKKDS